MKDLTKLQEDLKQIILDYEEKASGRIDNKNQIKQFNALVRNEDISEELINFIIDSTDEINTRHFQFVEHTTKTIREIGDITHNDIEKLKHLIDVTMKDNSNELEKVKASMEKKTPWYDFTKWSISDAKFFIIIILGIMVVGLFLLNATNVEFLNLVSTAVDSTKK